MVYIKVIQNLKQLCSKNKLPTQIIKGQQYIHYSHLRKFCKDLQINLKNYITSDRILSNLEIQQLKKPEPSPQHKKLMQQLNIKHERRMYNKLINKKQAQKRYFESSLGNESIKDFEKNISYAMTFLFSFFLAGVSGYFLGIYFLNYGHESAMIVAALFIMMTIIIQTSLFIIQIQKVQRMKKQKGKVDKKELNKKYYESQLQKKKNK